MTSVALIGLGRMGHPMARRIKEAGHTLAVYDADSSVAAAVAEELNVRLCVEGADFHDADVVITMLPTSKIVASALFETGIAQALKPGTRIVDMSSSNPSETLETARKAAELGLVFVDAPVSGGVGGAVQGTLAIMLGGDDEQVAPVIPVLEAMSKVVFRTGPVGSGHAMKALNNVVAGATTLASFEALAAGQAFGLDPATMVNIWNHSTARSFVSEQVFTNNVVTKTFDSGFALPLYAKDVGVARDLVSSAGVDAPIITAVAQSFSEALEVLGDVDHTRLYDLRDKD